MDQFLNKNHSKFTWLMDWVYILVLINILSILATLVGVGVFGFFPAWMTAHQLIKRRLNHEDFPLLKTFFETFKSYFWKANILGYILVTLGLVIAMSWFYYLSDLSTTFHWIGLIGVGFLAILLVLMIGITPISFVYFPKFKIVEHLKFTLIMTMGMPALALVIFLNSLFFYGVVMIRFITIFPFLAFTLPALVNLAFARKRLLKFFTVFKDEQMMIRTLNSYQNQDNLWTLWNQDDITHGLDYDQFVHYLNHHDLINHRASLVLTNQKEEALGMMLTRVQDQKIFIELIYVDAKYRRRGYAKKMIDWLEKEAKQSEIIEICFGDGLSLFDVLPQTLNLSLSFFRKNGYQVISVSNGYRFRKIIGGHPHENN